MLAVVGALMIWLHMRLNNLSEAIRHERELARTLDESLRRAQKGVQDLANAAETYGPDLQGRIQQSNSLLQDFDFVMDRAEKVLRKFDEAPQMSARMQNVAGETPHAVPQEPVRPNREMTADPGAQSKNNERSILLGSGLEQVLSEKQQQQQAVRKEDIRSTFMKAMQERERKIQSSVQQEESTPVVDKQTIDFLDTMPKTAPRSLGAQAYTGGETSEAEEDDLMRLRKVLEG